MNFKNLRKKSINFQLIPMIDLMMILTLFFAIMAFLPQFEGAIDTQLPKSSVQEKPPVAVTVILDQRGIIYIDGKTYTHSQLLDKATSILSKSSNVPVILAADKRLTYEYVMSVLDLLKSAGVKRLALATEGKGMN